MNIIRSIQNRIHEPPLNVKLLPTAQASLNDFNGTLHSLKASNIVLINKVKMMIAEGEKLSGILEKEYHQK